MFFDRLIFEMDVGVDWVLLDLIPLLLTGKLGGTAMLLFNQFVEDWMLSTDWHRAIKGNGNTDIWNQIYPNDQMLCHLYEAPK